MTLPLSGAITQLDINSEFGAPYNTPLTTMVRNGAYVQSGIGANASIPTAPPIGLNNFYGTQKNPPGELTNFVIGQDPTVATAKVLSMSSAGLYVPSYDGVNLARSQFVVDVRLRNAAGAVDGTSMAEGLGGATPIRQFRMGLVLGLTSVNPVGATNAAIAEGIICARQILFYKTTDYLYDPISINNYFVSAEEYPGSQYPRNYIIGSQFSTLILPSTTVYTHIRIRRGAVAVNGRLRWDILFYYNDFVTYWGTIDDDYPGGVDMSNAGGYLVLCNLAASKYENGSSSLDVNYAKFVTGTVTPAW